jgi:isopentenyl-diphosphate delta-isomerase
MALQNSFQIIFKNFLESAHEMTVFTSGRLKDGLDIAKCIDLGAKLGGMAGQFLKPAAISTKSAVQMTKLTKRQIEVTMFASGVGALEELRTGKLTGR